jgi:hypothetical protein
MKKLIIFGPWCGEFSYEIKWWIAEIRKVRNEQFKDHDAFMVGFRGRQFLYNDFIDKYFAYPSKMQDTLKYPATYGEHVNGKDIIPDNLFEYVKTIAKQHLDDYEEISFYTPGVLPIGPHRTLTESHYGHYQCYTPSDKISAEIKNQIQFDNDKESIVILARQRYRNGKPDRETWNPDHWMTFANLILSELDLNIIFMNLETKDSNGGSYDFSDHDINKTYSDRIKHINLHGMDSVERQISILQQTLCSVYGATGAATLALLAGTNLFTQQSKENGYRIHMEYKQFVNGYIGDKSELDFNPPVVFDKYNYSQLWDSPPIELFESFKNYLRLIKSKS